MAEFAKFCHSSYNRIMSQTSMNISLPDTLRNWVEKCVEDEGYGTASEYFRALVREDQKRKAKEEADRLLIGAIESGKATEMTLLTRPH